MIAEVSECHSTYVVGAVGGESRSRTSDDSGDSPEVVVVDGMLACITAGVDFAEPVEMPACNHEGV